jgi:hypothetical protein
VVGQRGLWPEEEIGGFAKQHAVMLSGRQRFQNAA